MIKKILVVLLIIHAIITSVFEIIYFHVPFWIEHFEFPNVFDFCTTLSKLFRVLSFILIFIGVIKLIKIKQIALIKIFRFPIYYFTAYNIFWMITTFFSTKFSFFVYPEDFPWFYYIPKFITIALLIFIFIHYLKVGERFEKTTKKQVSMTSRLINWGLDLIIILSLGIMNAGVLSSGYIFENVPYLNSNPNWFFLINMFFYYFIFEMLFLQTIGKLHNDSFVIYKKNRFKSILIRTLCRFIPFEPFSFLGKSGWHDSISKTKVSVTEK